ncbi:hypothetical protein NBRC10512_006646 [Rhodotorula toruloides]|uniref:Major facilitator superfamily protein n=1 Tax=Rhodotorula toruloides (strain NP11) TaxID=1130832 RepID=M7WWX6_RHOT1|nr:major facilitator superfamily protein [Rhodotorula toruloides NP11]EMS25122.1 major facilitator superfamily protein [Rhodotorula toruloides NP11]
MTAATYKAAGDAASPACAAAARPPLFSRLFRRRRQGEEDLAEDKTVVGEEHLSKRDFGFLPIPRRCRYSPDRPFIFTRSLNWLFAFGATIEVANVYYVQPIQVQLSQRYGVSYETVTRILSLVQAGYLVGLVFITPLGDLVPRRPLLLALIFLSATLTLGQATAPTFSGFQGLTFVVGLFTVSVQVFVPLTADLAPPEKRASSVSITLSGLIAGMVWGRLFGGVMARFTYSPNHVFWLAAGTQYALLVLMWAFLPDYPKKRTGLNYWQILRSMVTLFFTKPVLTQASLIALLSCSVMVSWWTSLTFLLDASPFHYNSFEIGLFGLCGIVSVVCAPWAGKLTDRISGWNATLLALCIQLATQAIALGAAQLNLAPVIICCILVDVAHQTHTIGNQHRIFKVDPQARSRINAVQATGSSAGPKVFLRYGWRACYALSLALTGTAILLLFLRGPNATPDQWVGWGGRYSLSPDVIEGRKAKKEKEETGGSEDRSGKESTAEDGTAAVEEEKKLESDLPAFPPQTRALEAGTT